MLISGFSPNSYVDYPKHIAAVVFFGGCNMLCSYCHNKEIVLKPESVFSANDVLKKVEKRRLFLDAVVLTGGEPTLQNTSDLINFISQLKKMGLKVKLDTNGTRPQALCELLPYVDYAAMDIKAPLEKYELITPVKGFTIDDIKESIALIKSAVGEFRTTVTPDFIKDDITSVAETIKGDTPYYLQQLVLHGNSDYNSCLSPDTLKEYAVAASAFVPTFTRGI